MTSTARVQRTLNAVAWSRAALVAIGAGAIVLVIAGLAAATGVLAGATRVGLVAALAVATLALVIVRWRSRGISELRAALWMEERAGSGYARVALAEDAASAGALLAPHQRAGLQSALATSERPSDISAALGLTSRRQLLGPALFAVASLALAVAGPRLAARVTGTSDVVMPGATAGDAGRTAQPMGRWRVRIVPPSYTGRAAQSLGDANSLRALAGSRIEIDGDGGRPAITARSPRADADAASLPTASSGGTVRPPAIDSLAVRSSGDEWRAALTVPAGPLELRASRGGTARLLLVDGYRDSIPHVALRLPARDSVLRRATGSLPLQALLHDDIGVATASFELIVSSGEGERFTARTVTLGAQRFSGARDATLRGSLDLDALKLGPGDVIHLRAVARDGYPLVGREAGSSETRSFRIARASEYDSIAVEPAPPPAVDSSLLSQRMLLLLTERLEKRRPSLQRPVLVSESQRLARDQGRLRQSIGNVVFQRLTGEQGGEHAHAVGDGHEHGVDVVDGKLALPGNRDANGGLVEGDDSPVIAINRPLLEAYNAMWDAGRALELAEPRAAIPYMKLALAAIERARTASRLYLRGKPPVVIVDIAKVRLVGKDTGRANVRSERAPLPQRDAARERRLLAAVSLLAADATAARDSLAVLRLESVGDAREFADALSATLDALQGGRDLTPSLVRARRALGGVTRLPSGLWSRGTP
jgi:hypothetical protein